MLMVEGVKHVPPPRIRELTTRDRLQLVSRRLQPAWNWGNASRRPTGQVHPLDTP